LLCAISRFEAIEMSNESVTRTLFRSPMPRRSPEALEIQNFQVGGGKNASWTETAEGDRRPSYIPASFQPPWA
jgi:hypothetical protein